MTCVVLEWVPLRSENEFEPHAQNEILVALMGFSKIVGVVCKLHVLVQHF